VLAVAGRIGDVGGLLAVTTISEIDNIIRH
jgi:hypothetical protein